MDTWSDEERAYLTRTYLGDNVDEEDLARWWKEGQEWTKGQDGRAPLEGVALLRAIVQDRGLAEGHEALDELIARAEGKQMNEQEALRRLAMGGTLVLTIPRDDFAHLMAMVAQIESDEGSPTSENDVRELSRIASDLSQQADAQD